MYLYNQREYKFYTLSQSSKYNANIEYNFWQGRSANKRNEFSLCNSILLDLEW